MSGGPGGGRAERKALLATRAELDRMRVTLAVREIRTVVVPPPGDNSVASKRPTAALLVSLAGPMIGGARLGRWMRIASVAMMVVRVVRNWRTVH